MENYTAKDILKEIKNIFPKYKTRKRSYVDKRNYLICILYYRFNYSEEMIADIFSLTKFAIDRSTVNYKITKGEAVKKLMEIGLNISGTNLTEMLLWEE